MTPVNHFKFQASTKFAFCYFHVSWKFSTLAGFTVELFYKAAQRPGGKEQKNGNSNDCWETLNGLCCIFGSDVWVWLILSLMDLPIGEQILHLMESGLWMGFLVVISQNKLRCCTSGWLRRAALLYPVYNELGACTSCILFCSREG